MAPPSFGLDETRARLPYSLSLGGDTTLASVGTNYDGIAASKGLGMAEIDFTGVTAIDFAVFVNKIGSGTQSWQLWNMTDGMEIGVIDDAVASGDKTLTATITTGIPTGIKRVRIRSKSTVGLDAPVYYGSSLALR